MDLKGLTFANQICYGRDVHQHFQQPLRRESLLIGDGVSCFRGRNPSAARWMETGFSLDWFNKIQIHGIEYCRENVHE
jgi:hypothetical protein